MGVMKQFSKAGRPGTSPGGCASTATRSGAGLDRLETVVVAVLIVGFLAAAPLAAAAAGTWLHGNAARTQHAQQASRRQVTAVVLWVAAPKAGGYGGAWQAQAKWRALDGREVTGEVPVPSSTVVGGKLRVSTSPRTGDVTSAPLTDAQVANQTTSAEAAGVIAVGTVLAVVGAGTFWTLNRRRMAAWDADWQATEPRWTTRA